MKATSCVSATAEKTDGTDRSDPGRRKFETAVSGRDEASELWIWSGADEDNDPPKLKPVEVQGGVKDQILCKYANTFRYLDTSGANLAGVTKKAQMKQSVKVPRNRK